MIFIVATAFWLLAIFIVVRLFAIGRDAEPASSITRTLHIAILVACIPLFSRPHDLVLSGQDSGTYLNSAAAFA